MLFYSSKTLISSQKEDENKQTALVDRLATLLAQEKPLPLPFPPEPPTPPRVKITREARATVSILIGRKIATRAAR